MYLPETDKLFSRMKNDPLFFCRNVLGIDPWSKQAEVLHALRDHDRVAVRSGHGTGKSFIAAASALWFLYSHYPAKVITTAPTWNQVRHILWNELRRMHASAPVALGGKVLEERIKLSADSFAVGLSTDEPERLQGYHAENVLVILDEAPGVKEDIWHAAETLLTGRVGKILAIGNPTRPAGLFYQAF
ncbi:MAG: DEAD/DEAH box helicase family protein, partial [Planctomycetes bacterium]|nr:DEAD/DEAH box helicase family protein [Planctomycetota bacterium]